MKTTTAHPLFRAFAALLLTAFATLAGAALAQDGEVVEIEMITEGSEFYNDPVGLIVEPGTTIRFVNVSGQHSATAYSEANGKMQRIPPEAESWNSNVLVQEGATFEVTLTAEGVYDYYCLPHEALGMVGRIIVGDASAFPAQPTDGMIPGAAEALPSVEMIQAQDDGVLTYAEWQEQQGQ